MNTKKILGFSIGPIGGAILGIVTLPIIAWNYSPEDVGRIAMLQVLTNFCILVFSLGLDQAYIREYHDSNNKPALLKLAIVPGLVILSLALTACYVNPTLLSKALFSIDSTTASILIGICILSAFVSRFLSLILRMQERGMAFSMSQVLPKILFASIIGIYILFSFGFSLLHLVLAHTISILSVALIYTWNTRNVWMESLNHSIDKAKLYTLLQFGFPLILGSIAYWILTSIDKLLLRSLSSFEELAIYSITSSFAAAAVIFQSVFSTVWAPAVYKWAAEGKNLDKIDEISEHVLAAIMTMFTLTGIFSWITSYLLPDKYENVQYILVACMAFPLFYTLSETTVIGLGIARKSIYSMAASVTAALINVAGCYLLIPKYGASGAAISTAASLWIFLVLRTELSCIAWRPLPRAKLYITTFISLIISIGFSLKGHEHRAFFITLWIIALALFFFTFKTSFTLASSIILRSNRQPKKAKPNSCL